ncbi:MAG: FAD-binding oxidoreductase [Pigmentiphaga sp.]|nr:FAD-binding oxidoreductase [Pigmentiphaga sp.]
MTHIANTLLAELGAEIVLTDPADIEPWLTDWRGIYKGRAQAVVRPQTTEQVSRCLSLCHAAQVPVVTRGGNTGLCGGATPLDDDATVIISLDRMNAIRSIDRLGNTMIAEAGCILGNLRRAAAENERMLPISLAAEDSCQIGGNVATNAGGVHVVRYGMMRDWVLGLEVVLPDGRVLNLLRTLRKDNTGYDLKQLFIGSEGTLGVITAVALRLAAPVRARAVMLAAVESPRHALQLFEHLSSACADRLEAYEFMTGEAMALACKHVPELRSPFPDPYPAYVLAELTDSRQDSPLEALLEEVLGEALEKELCVDVSIAQSLTQMHDLWRLREEISEAQKFEGPHLKHDISIPIPRIADFMEAAQALLARLDSQARPIVFGHFGDGNLHYNVSAPEGAPKGWSLEAGPALTDEILELVNQFGGSISAEHGIGQLKRSHFLAGTDPVELALMQGIKKLLDPQQLMNPGKLL